VEISQRFVPPIRLPKRIWRGFIFYFPSPRIIKSRIRRPMAHGPIAAPLAPIYRLPACGGGEFGKWAATRPAPSPSPCFRSKLRHGVWRSPRKEFPPGREFFFACLGIEGCAPQHSRPPSRKPPAPESPNRSPSYAERPLVRINGGSSEPLHACLRFGQGNGKTPWPGS